MQNGSWSSDCIVARLCPGEERDPSPMQIHDLAEMPAAVFLRHSIILALDLSRSLGDRRFQFCNLFLRFEASTRGVRQFEITDESRGLRSVRGDERSVAGHRSKRFLLIRLVRF